MMIKTSTLSAEIALKRSTNKHTSLCNADQEIYDYASLDNVKSISRIEADSYDEFFSEFLSKNRPCILSSSVTKDWKCVKEWKSDNGPDLEFLASNFGEMVVPVANCRQCEYNSQPKQEMKLSSFMEYWRTVLNDTKCKSENCLYLKDWHLWRQKPDYQPYILPECFQSDWLNEACDAGCFNCDEDFRFVYMGPKGSWTPFHADVYRSYSWSANVCGRKKWILYPKGHEENLKDAHGNLPYDVANFELNNKVDSHRIEVIQEQGEIIFVPSGWYHQVFNLEDTISVNHNWLNGCNIHHVWAFLQQELKDVEREIDDCKLTMTPSEWHRQCQMIMRVNTGMNMSDFLAMLSLVARRRIETLSHNVEKSASAPPNKSFVSQPCWCETLKNLELSIKENTSPRSPGFNQAVFDLCCVWPVLSDFRQMNWLSGKIPDEEVLEIRASCENLYNSVNVCLHTLAT